MNIENIKRCLSDIDANMTELFERIKRLEDITNESIDVISLLVERSSNTYSPPSLEEYSPNRRVIMDMEDAVKEDLK